MTESDLLKIRSGLEIWKEKKKKEKEGWTHFLNPLLEQFKRMQRIVAINESVANAKTLTEIDSPLWKKREY